MISIPDRITGIYPIIVRETNEPVPIATIRDANNPSLYNIRIIVAYKLVDLEAYKAWLQLVEERGFNVAGYHPSKPGGPEVLVITGDDIADVDYVALLAELEREPDQ